MKKTVLIAILLVGMATSSFAGQVGGGTGTALGSTQFKTSSGVLLFATASNTAYTVASKHTSGDTLYTANNVDANIVEDQKAGYKGDAITSETGAGVSQ